jgi:hypothetical protein
MPKPVARCVLPVPLSLIGIANTRCWDLVDPHLEQTLLPMAPATAKGCRIELHQSAGSSLADNVSVLEPAHNITLIGWPQSFFEITSWSMALSRLRLATSYLSLLFSSSR